MSDKHLSTQFDTELSGISNRVLEMGGLVEAQVAQAVFALTHFSNETADQVIRQEHRVNQMEIEVDRDLSTIIARRQPTARDLRLLIATSKTIGNLERVGDEAARIARTVQRLMNTGMSSRLPVGDVSFEATLATTSLRRSLDAFARLDAGQALQCHQAGQRDRRRVRRPDAQAHHVHDGRPAHHLGVHRPGLRRQGDRARR